MDSIRFESIHFDPDVSVNGDGAKLLSLDVQKNWWGVERNQWTNSNSNMNGDPSKWKRFGPTLRCGQSPPISIQLLKVTA